jgi:hypothetical protein
MIDVITQDVHSLSWAVALAPMQERTAVEHVTRQDRGKADYHEILLFAFSPESGVCNHFWWQ